MVRGRGRSSGFWIWVCDGRGVEGWVDGLGWDKRSGIDRVGYVWMHSQRAFYLLAGLHWYNDIF